MTGWILQRARNRPIRSGLWIAVAIATVLTVWNERDRGERSSAAEYLSHKDIVYRQTETRSPAFDVYFPGKFTSRSNRPAIVAFHGGCWIGGDKHEHAGWFLPFVARGFVLIGVNYRVASAVEPSWPDSLADARAAIRRIRSNAREFGIDPDRIVAVGTDTGGWLAELLAVDPDGDDPGGNPPVSARVSAAVAFSAPSDLLRLAEESRGAVRSIGLALGGSVDRSARRAREASPALKVTRTASPLLLIHGSDDALVPADQSMRLKRAYAPAGVLCRVEIVPGGRHGFGPIVNGRDFFPVMLEFFDRVWNDKNPLAAMIDPIVIDRVCGLSSFDCSRLFGNDSIRAGSVVYSLQDRGPRLNMNVFERGSGASASFSGGFIIG
jgi:acetyl esterase/lipase